MKINIDPMHRDKECERNSQKEQGNNESSTGESENKPSKVKMFRNTYQSGFLSIFYAIGYKPLNIWCTRVQNGHIKRITDYEIRSLTLELIGNNVSTTYIEAPNCPSPSLGIRLPFLVLVVKNLKRYFTFEVEVLDDQNFHRRFRCSNFQSKTKVRPFNCTMPLRLDNGWNQVQVNLCDFTRRAYGTVYVETVRVQIHANCRLRRVYFCEKLYREDQLPADFKVFVLNAMPMAPVANISANQNF